MRGQQCVPGWHAKVQFPFPNWRLSGPEETPQKAEDAKEGMEKRAEENSVRNDTAKKKDVGWQRGQEICLQRNFPRP